MRHSALSPLRRLAAALLCLCLFCTALPSLAAAQKTVSVSFTVTTYQNRARELLKQLNAYRVQNGLPALVMTADLENAALQRAAELFVYYGHDRPDNSEYDTVLAQYASLQKGLACAESIAAGYSKAAEALDTWQADAADSLLDGDFTHAGVACIYMKDSYNEYYWVLLLTGQPDDFKGKAADATAKAGKTKSVTATVASGVLQKPDSSHDRFELRASDLNLKTRQSATPTVYLYDRRGVKIGKCALDDLSYKSSNTSVFTVAADGTVKRKKAGSGTLTISAPGLSSIKCAVTTGSASASQSASNSAAVTAATIGDCQPELKLTEYAKTTRLSVYLRGSSGYVLYRCSTKSGSYSKVAEKATTSRWEYSIDNGDISKTYYYKVRACKNSNGKRVYSEYSAAVKVAP